MSQPFNTINVNVLYNNIVKYATDDRFYSASNPTPIDLDTLINRPMGKIRLLELQAFIHRPLYNAIVGEAPNRKVINFYALFTTFKYKGVILYDKKFNLFLKAVLTNTDSIFNFGQGVIIDELVFPSSILNIVIDSAPPTNNDIISLEVIYVIKYNQNY